MTIAAASSHIVTALATLPRSSSERMEYWVDLMPTGASAES
jgi:hypothetical protein